jgi:hypothetical protein
VPSRLPGIGEAVSFCAWGRASGIADRGTGQWARVAAAGGADCGGGYADCGLRCAVGPNADARWDRGRRQNRGARTVNVYGTIL